MRRLAALWLLAGALSAGESLPDESAARKRGIEALPSVLACVNATDPDCRLRARRLATRLALDFYAANAPKGMRFIPGPVEVTGSGVRCGGLYLAVHEVTLGEFRAYARDRGLDLKRFGAGADSLPVTNVSLREARAYARAHGARLPTEKELLHAGRGGGRYRYPWGDRFEPGRANGAETGGNALEPVGKRADGLSVHGLDGLLGNAAEWTETDAGRGGGQHYSVFGGSYRVAARTGVRRTYRLAETARLPDVGFRLAQTLPEISPRRS